MYISIADIFLPVFMDLSIVMVKTIKEAE